MEPEQIKALVEAKIPIYLVARPLEGIKRDCPMELRDKEYRRKVMCMRIMKDIADGFTDSQIIDKYT